MSPLRDPLAQDDDQRLKLFFYVVPVVGVFPALWTLYRQQGTVREQQASRTMITLTLGWLMVYVLLGAGAQASDTSLAISLLFTSAMASTGYFLTCCWLIWRVWRGKSTRLPGLTSFGDRLP